MDKSKGGVDIKEREIDFFPVDASAREKHREEADSELEFNFKQFRWSFFIELLPDVFNYFFVRIMEGEMAAKNRGFRTLYFGIVKDIIVGPHLHIIYSLIFSTEENSIFFIFNLIIWTILRAGTVAVKYAHYGREDLDGENSINTSNYWKHQRATKKQLTSWCLDAHGDLPAVILENFYNSCVRAGYDLHKLYFQLADEQTCRTFFSYMDYWNLYLVEIQKREQRASQKLKRSALKTNQVTDLNHISTKRKGTQQKSGTSSYKHHKYYSHETENIFRPFSKEDIDEMVEQRRIPAVYLGLLIAFQSYCRKSYSNIVYVTSSLMMVNFCFGRVIRYLNDKPIFGSTWQAISVDLVQFFPSLFLSMLVYYYAICPAIDFVRRKAASESLLHLISSKGFKMLPKEKMPAFMQQVDQSGDGNSPGVTPPLDHNTIRIDMSNTNNVTSFYLLLQLLHGSKLNEQIVSRYSYYCVLSFSAVIISTLGISFLNLFNSELDRPDTDISIPVFIHTLCVAGAVILQVTLAFGINYYSRYIRCEIIKKKFLSQVQFWRLRSMNAKEKITNSSTNEKALKSVISMLDTIEREIRAKESAFPMRVMFLRAEPAAISVILSILGATLWLDFQRLMNDILTLD